MRFLVVGLILTALGIGLTEYARRHPPDAQSSATSGAVNQAHTSAVPPTVSALLETTSPAGATSDSVDEAQTRLGKLAAHLTEAGFTTVLSGDFTVRELHGGDGYAVLVADLGGAQAVVRVGGGEAKVLAVRKDTITAMAADGATVLWAEGSRVYSTSKDGGALTARATFARALVTSLTSHGGVTLATLVPKDLDPFSTDPTGAVVALDGSAAKLVAGEQIRPHDVLTDGKEAFWISGYPSGLVRGALDGSSTSRIADRADGPVALDGAALVFRYPMSSNPEVRRIARAGGNLQTLAHFDVDWLAAGDGFTAFTTTGIAPRVYQVKPGEEPHEVLAFKGTAKGLAWAGGQWVVALTDSEGKTAVRLK